MTDLQPNIQDLQKDVIDLLKEISALMERAKNDLSADGSGDKYGKSHEEVKEAICNVENLELRMAIVAPMKAGKSTIINAIIGQDLLPSRNAAMTTLPTKILFNSELNEPILVLSEEIISVFQDVLKNLQERINSRGTEWLQEKIAQYPHLTTLATEIQTGSFSIPKEVTGKEKISEVLTKLNDIVRLCSSLDPSQDPLAKLTDVPCIKTSFWQNESTETSQQIGHLVIVDTPGPNEAGENLRLTAVVEQELKKSSIVLIILDFTQLNNQAAEQVKRQVEPVVNLIKEENLYVLVNKVDQRRNGDMTPEQVKKFVFADLNLSKSNDSDRIFEISARQAFCATSFLRELQQNPEIDIPEMKTIEALAKEILGTSWSRKLQRTNIEELQKEAEYLWLDSGFKTFLEKAIKALMESAAPRCMLSALMRCRGHLLALKDNLHLRSQSISQDAEKLQQEIDLLEADLKHLELCCTEFKSVDKIKINLQSQLSQILKQLKEEAQVSIENHFEEKNYERSNFVKQGSIFVKKALADVDILPKSIRNKLKYQANNILEFTYKNEADAFVNEALAWAIRRAENLLNQARNNAEIKIKQEHHKLVNSLETKTKDILGKARDRLNKAFDVELSLPPNPQINNQLSSIDFQVNSATRQVTDYKPEKYRPFYFLFLIERERKVPITKTEFYYTVSLEELVKEINTSVETSINKINKEVNHYLDEDFKQCIDSYFAELNEYLSNYRNSLRQGQADQRLSLKKRDELTYNLRNLARSAQEQRKKTDAYIERTKKYLPDYLL